MGRDVVLVLVLVSSVFIDVQHKTSRQSEERGDGGVGQSQERRSGGGGSDRRKRSTGGGGESCWVQQRAQRGGLQDRHAEDRKQMRTGTGPASAQGTRSLRYLKVRQGRHELVQLPGGAGSGDPGLLLSGRVQVVMATRRTEHTHTHTST